MKKQVTVIFDYLLFLCHFHCHLDDPVQSESALGFAGVTVGSQVDVIS